MEVWESNGTGELIFDAMGHIVEYDNLMQALMKVVVDQNKYVIIILYTTYIYNVYIYITYI